MELSIRPGGLAIEIDASATPCLHQNQKSITPHSFFLRIVALLLAIGHCIPRLEMKASDEDRSQQDDIGFESIPSHLIKAHKSNDHVGHGLVEKEI